MVHFNLVGRASSPEYAICDRLLDIMSVSLPDFTATKTPISATKWPEEAMELMRKYGFRLPVTSDEASCDIVIYGGTGRLLCTEAEFFSTFAMRNYGIKLDLSEADLVNYVRANMEEARQQQQMHVETDDS